MSYFARAQLIAILLCLPLGAHAQLFKCKQADGKIAYQDAACATQSTTESVMAKKGRKTSAGLMDAECSAQMRGAETSCSFQDSVTQCLKERVTPVCAAQITKAGPDGMDRTKSGSCNQEVRAAIDPCVKKVIVSTLQCMKSRISASCSAKLSRIDQVMEAMAKSCYGDFDKWNAEVSRTCTQGTEPEYLQCVRYISEKSCRK